MVGWPGLLSHFPSSEGCKRKLSWKKRLMGQYEDGEHFTGVTGEQNRLKLGEI